MNEVKKQARSIDDRRINLAEHWQQHFVVNAEEGTTIEEVLSPEYWAHVAGKFQQFDRIDVRMETGEWVLDLMVLASGRNWARMHVLQKYELEHVEQGVAPTTAHRITWKGPQHKFAVIRVADDEMVQSGFTDRNAAEVWRANHEKVTKV